MSGTKSGKKSSVKKKSLFDHVNAVTSEQHPNYWDEISDDDKKTWSNFMVNRFLSMKPEWIEFVNDYEDSFADKVSQLGNEYLAYWKAEQNV